MGYPRPHAWAVLHRLFCHPIHAGSPLVTVDAQRAREEAASWLILLDDDPDDQEQQARFRAWLAADPANAAAWASVNRTSGLLASAPTPPIARARTWPRPSFRMGIATAGMALAACLLVVLTPTILINLRADEATGTAEIRTVRLIDGSSVRLGPESAIAVSYAKGRRTVALLAGEAYFDVAHDPRPFQVTARDAVITDLGTRFDVDMRSEATAVAVNHGLVRVESGGRTYDLRPGDWWRLDPAGRAAQGAGLSNDLTAGPSARISARNSPVASVVDDIRPWFAGRIVVADAALGERPVTGVFDAADPAKALQALVGPAGGRVIRVTPWLLIVTSG